MTTKSKIEVKSLAVDLAATITVIAEAPKAYENTLTGARMIRDFVLKIKTKKSKLK